MRKRYGTTQRGETTEVAKIYDQNDHRIDNGKIDGDAVKVASRLKKYNYQAFLVGGAVRDLVLDKVPKDFDLVTDATPQQIKSIFRNARIIGKRFRLVHVYFPGKIIELSTFRANTTGKDDQLSEERIGQVLDGITESNYAAACEAKQLFDNFLDYVAEIRGDRVAAD